LNARLAKYLKGLNAYIVIPVVYFAPSCSAPLHYPNRGEFHKLNFLGEERANEISPINSALQKNIRSTIHIDTPVVSMDVLKLIWSAVNRETNKSNILGTQERISPIQAIRATPVDAAWQCFEKKLEGL